MKGSDARSAPPDNFDLPQLTLVELTRRTIDCPSDGFVLALGESEFFNGGLVINAVVALRIEQTATGHVGSVVDTAMAVQNASVFCSCLFTVNAGNNTFRLIGSQGATNEPVNARDFSLTLLFIPTAYGVVDTDQ